MQVPYTEERAKSADFYSRRDAYEALLAQIKGRMSRDSILLMEVLKELA